MKQYKQFRAEQQHLAEIGPIGAVMMGAMGLFGLGFAGYKMYKKTKEGITGYVESRSQKKDNKKNGMDISLKVYNPASGKEEHQDFYIDPSKKPMNPELEEMGVKIKKSDLNTDDEGISKLEKSCKVALFSHPHPDPDSIGSMMAGTGSEWLALIRQNTAWLSRRAARWPVAHRIDGVNFAAVFSLCPCTDIAVPLSNHPSRSQA